MSKNLLTASQIKSATYHLSGKLKEKPRRHNDGEGLYLIAFKSGLKSWRYNYSFTGRQQTIVYGSYPDLSLSEARESHREALKLKMQGINPAERKQIEKLCADTFQIIATEWIAHKFDDWAVKTKTRKLQLLRDFINPAFGDRPIREIEPPEILQLLRKIEKMGKRETAHKTKETISLIFRYAVFEGKVERDKT